MLRYSKIEVNIFLYFGYRWRTYSLETYIINLTSEATMKPVSFGLKFWLLPKPLRKAWKYGYLHDWLWKWNCCCSKGSRPELSKVGVLLSTTIRLSLLEQYVMYLIVIFSWNYTLYASIHRFIMKYSKLLLFLTIFCRFSFNLKKRTILWGWTV